MEIMGTQSDLIGRACGDSEWNDTKKKAFVTQRSPWQGKNEKCHLRIWLKLMVVSITRNILNVFNLWICMPVLWQQSMRKVNWMEIGRNWKIPAVKLWWFRVSVLSALLPFPLRSTFFSYPWHRGDILLLLEQKSKHA